MKALHKRQVVVTGLGMLTPLGGNTTTSWEALLAGTNGIQSFETPIGYENYVTRYGGHVPTLPPQNILSAKDARNIPPYIRFGILAADEAIRDAGLADDIADRTRFGVILGSVCGGMGVISDSMHTIAKKGPGAVSPRFIMNAPINMLSGEVSVRYGLQGPVMSLSTHGSTGAHSIGQAARKIKYGDADVMLAGASDAPLTDDILPLFAAEGILSRDREPNRASRPFNANRNGIVLSEGAAVMVLEERRYAENRGARIYAEFAGYGASADARHPTEPSPDGEGLARAMLSALTEAGATAGGVHYITAHGESSQHGDRAEACAISRIFQDCQIPPVVSAPKSQLGHMMGAAGAAGAAFTVLSLHHQVAPPTLNWTERDKECPLNLAVECRPLEMKLALVNAYGHGVNNAVLAFRRTD